MISFSDGNSLLNYLTSQASPNAGLAGGSTASGTVTTDTNAKARAAATSPAALQAAGSTHRAVVAGRALDKQQAALAGDLRAAMSKVGVKLTGSAEFSVSSDGTVEVKGGDADKAATTAFLKADITKPSFATRIATQARDALKLSSTIQQSAAISQAARYAGTSGGVMSLHTSLMQASTTTTAVFIVSATSSSLSYPGSLATKA